MGVYKQKKSKYWWYKFVWNGEVIRESTKQANKQVAKTIEAAHRTALAKGEVGIRERKRVPTLKEFAENDFKPYVGAQFKDKPKTLEYYLNGTKSLLAYPNMTRLRMDAVNAAKIGAYVASRRDAGLKVASINRELEVLRRMLKLAHEWGKIDKPPQRVSMLPGENRREQVLSANEETAYINATSQLGQLLEQDYEKALSGLRAKKGKQPLKPDSFLLRDVVAILADCGLRPEECFRLKWSEVQDGSLNIQHGKTENARRKVPTTARVSAMLEMRGATRNSEWVFPASTSSGHIEKSSLRKQHLEACKLAEMPAFPIYTLRHTCLTRWAAFMDPYTLAYLAGHSDFATTKRYVHPQVQTVRDAMERARAGQGGHTSRHTGEKSPQDTTRLDSENQLQVIESKEENLEMSGRGEWIRTTDLLVPNQAL
jgi:integrase